MWPRALLLLVLAAPAWADGPVAASPPAGASAPSTRPSAAEELERATPLPGRKGAAPATSQPAGTNAAPVGSVSDPLDLKRLGIALGVVLAIIFISQKVWRRVGMPGIGNKANGTLQVVSRLSIAPRQQVLLIRVGRRCVLAANNGTQMTPLCEISDPDEVAVLLGQALPGRTSSAAFNEVLSTASGDFEQEKAPAPREPRRPGAASAAPIAADDDEVSAPELAKTREELGDLMERVRSLSKQFSK